MGLVFASSYVGSINAGENLVTKFKDIQKERHPESSFGNIKKLAIQAPAQTEFSINGEDFVIPLTGFFELGFGLIDIYELIFKSNVDVNIVYMF